MTDTTEQIKPVACDYLMADGKTPLLEYLRDTVDDVTDTDEWTAGYEECKRRLYKIIAPQNAMISETVQQLQRELLTATEQMLTQARTIKQYQQRNERLVEALKESRQSIAHWFSLATAQKCHEADRNHYKQRMYELDAIIAEAGGKV